MVWNKGQSMEEQGSRFVQLRDILAATWNGGPSGGVGELREAIKRLKVMNGMSLESGVYRGLSKVDLESPLVEDVLNAYQALMAKREKKERSKKRGRVADDDEDWPEPKKQSPLPVEERVTPPSTAGVLSRTVVEHTPRTVEDVVPLSPNSLTTLMHQAANESRRARVGQLKHERNEALRAIASLTQTIISLTAVIESLEY